MSKHELCYSNTIIYKIYCNDDSITDVYIGHTTNFMQRKCHHKSACANLKNKLKLYNIIRENGGWNNWGMVEIAKYNCKDKTDARIKEQHHYEEFNSTLNSCPPFVNNKSKEPLMTILKNSKLLPCTTCDKQFKNSSSLSKHTKKCQYDTKIPENTEKFCCQKCHYYTSRKSQFDRHNLTTKHIKAVEHVTNIEAQTLENDSGINIFICSCGKKYNHRQSLFTHKKTCIPKEEINEKEIILTLLEQNTQLQNQNTQLQNQNTQLQNQIIELYKENNAIKTQIIK